MSFFWTMSGRGTSNLLKNHQQQFHNRTTVVALHSRKICKYNWVTRSLSSNHLTRCQSERNTLLIPNKYQSEAVVRLVDSEEGDETLLQIPRYTSHDDIFMSLIHVALKIRGDLLDTPGHKDFSVSEDEAINCVPDSL